jgi:purine-nucleoside phosphorylase
MKTSERLQETVKFIRSKSKLQPKAGFVLGSGLSFFGNLVQVEHRFKFSEIPHFCPPTVEGHPGELILGHLEGVPVAVMKGRVHAYEGHSFQEVVFPVRTLARLGIQVLTVTNAAGGLNPKMKPGEMMIIKDQINLTGQNPLVGPNVAELGPRFPDMTDVYEPKLRALLKKALIKAKVRHTEGVYVGVLGPSFETAAEIKYFGKIGGGAVGMSTVAEVIAARHAGLQIAGLSCITNLGTGLSKKKLSHHDVAETAARVEKGFAAALTDFTRSLKSELK